MRRKDFMQRLAEGQRYLRLDGRGYFSWRLPVEAVKVYCRNDPGTVAALRAGHDAALEDLRRRLDETVRGRAVRVPSWTTSGSS